MVLIYLMGRCRDYGKIACFKCFMQDFEQFCFFYLICTGPKAYELIQFLDLFRVFEHYDFPSHGSS